MRRKLPLEFIRLDAEAAPAWRAALRTRYAEIAKLNAAHGTSFAGFDEIPLPRSAPDRGPVRADWELFIQDAACPVARLEVYGPRQAFEEYLAAKSGKAGDGVPPSPAPPAECQRHGLLSTPGMAEAAGASGVAETSRPFSPAASAIPVLKETRGCATLQRGAGRGENALAPISLPFGRLLAAADWADMQARRGALKWEFTTRNFRHVAGYILLHGNGVRNTVIYCILAVLTALVVNPLAAYALSRFRLPATYQILLFCMATMTFPGEVTMIPSFLLLRRFPLWPLLAGLAAAMAVFLLLRRGRPTWTDGARLLTALCAGSLTGGLLVPLLMPSPNVSLLNSFAALVLPGMANGFFIFLLKGFFDSLPQELYESAEIDGASEWHKFWHITMTLSKPILAVVALNAFTVAYSAFMFALIIVPDPEMWTMMVWIYQLGTQSHQAVVYASLVLAAIPTFIILAFCQNIIMRGLVVPTEK